MFEGRVADVSGAGCLEAWPVRPTVQIVKQCIFKYGNSIESRGKEKCGVVYPRPFDRARAIWKAVQTAVCPSSRREAAVLLPPQSPATPATPAAGLRRADSKLWHHCQPLFPLAAGRPAGRRLAATLAAPLPPVSHLRADVEAAAAASVAASTAAGSNRPSPFRTQHQPAGGPVGAARKGRPMAGRYRHRRRRLSIDR